MLLGFGGFYNGIKSRAGFSKFYCVSECPVFPTNHRRMHRVFSTVVVMGIGSLTRLVVKPFQYCTVQAIATVKH